MGLYRQPPSGGCVLKLLNTGEVRIALHPAAFGRLRVETSDFKAFDACRFVPAAFGRLRVETVAGPFLKVVNLASRLRAAAC